MATDDVKAAAIPLPGRGPAPPVATMSNDELVELVQAEHPYRGRALFELSDRIAGDDDAATKLGALSQLPSLRTVGLFDRVSLACAAIIALLAAETPHSRATAYDAFAALDESAQANLLDYLECTRIEDAHPRIS
jgi:hypothetical protein